MVDYLIWDTIRWKNGISRTISSHLEFDPYDSRLQIASGSGRKGFIDGMGNAYLSGVQARIVIHASQYNGKLEGTFQLNTTVSSFELRLRSRHLLTTLPQDERFGGYACAVSLTQAIFVRETFHDSYTTLATVNLATALVNAKDYPMSFSVIDSGATVLLELKIDYGSGLISAATNTDATPPTPATNLELFKNKSHAWVRTNGTEPKDFSMKDLKVIRVL